MNVQLSLELVENAAQLCMHREKQNEHGLMQMYLLVMFCYWPSAIAYCFYFACCFVFVQIVVRALLVSHSQNFRLMAEGLDSRSFHWLRTAEEKV